MIGRVLTNLATAVILTVGFFAVGSPIFFIGVDYGRHHPDAGQVLVPAKTGTPSDLPGWACRELVNDRVAQLRRFERARGIVDHEGSGVVHRADPAVQVHLVEDGLSELRAFLGPKLGACPR